LPHEMSPDRDVFTELMGILLEIWGRSRRGPGETEVPLPAPRDWGR
jgi:hypothetical protein